MQSIWLPFLIDSVNLLNQSMSIRVGYNLHQVKLFFDEISRIGVDDT
ncbi:hypothetical protein [Bacillus sp. ISL-57]